jgi:bis(5'-nucleosidyl)-tetraphosphatase
MRTKLRKRSAGVVVVRRIEGEWRFLLLRCYRYWDFPKGEVEPDEHPLETARREVAEETCLDHLDFRWGEAYTETLPYGDGKIARYYLAEAPSGTVILPVSAELGAPEHHEFRWVDAVEASSLLNDRVRRVLAWGLNEIHGENDDGREPGKPRTGA